MSELFKVCLVILIVALALFIIICIETGFECALPNAGHFSIKWDYQKKKFDLFLWQPKKNIKPLPKDALILRGEKKEDEGKQ